MKNCWLLGVLVLALGQPVLSQDQPPMPPGGRGPMMPDSAQIVQMVDELAGKLTLTVQQKEKVLKIHQAHYAEMKKLRSDESMDREARREKMRGMRDKMSEQIKALLNEDQAKIYDEYLKEQQSHRMMRPGGPPSGPRP